MWLNLNFLWKKPRVGRIKSKTGTDDQIKWGSERSLCNANWTFFYETVVLCFESIGLLFVYRHNGLHAVIFFLEFYHNETFRMHMWKLYMFFFVWPLCCLSSLIVLFRLAIVLFVFFDCSFSFGHCVVCLLWFTASVYLLVIFKRFLDQTDLTSSSIW